VRGRKRERTPCVGARGSAGVVGLDVLSLDIEFLGWFGIRNDS